MALYLDSSALVKLIVREPESEALRRHVAASSQVTSVLALVEVRRSVSRRTPAADERTTAVLARPALMPLSNAVVDRAARLRPLEVRTPDAIHLASALVLAEELEGFVTYDLRQAEAAEALGLPVVAPT